jgi:hypothetical protein
MANKATFAPVVSPAIVLGALKTFKDTDAKLNKIVATVAADRSKAVNLVLDAMFVACDKPKVEFLKGNAATNAARYQVKTMFDSIVEAGHLESSTGKTYQTCFWIAFNQGIAWSPDLANKKTADKQAGGAKTDSPKSGAVEKTDIPALHKTLSKALAQARLLNQSIFAADLVDLITDTWPDFKETVLTK